MPRLGCRRLCPWKRYVRLHDVPRTLAQVDDCDSDFVRSESMTRSLDSTVYNYREEFGRTYHGECGLTLGQNVLHLVLTLQPGYKDGRYFLPNDEVCPLAPWRLSLILETNLLTV